MRQVVAFLLGILLYEAELQKNKNFYFILWLLSLIFIFFNKNLAYAGVALIVFEVFRWINPKQVHTIIKFLANYSYELFLVHGPCLLLTRKFLELSPLLSAILGLSLGIFLAWITKVTTKFLQNNIASIASLKLFTNLIKIHEK